MTSENTQNHLPDTSFEGNTSNRLAKIGAVLREAREAQKAQAKQEAQQVANPSPSLSQQDQEFSKFFNYMERYDRIKAVRKRQNARTYTSNNPQSNKQSQPTNRGKTQSLQTPHTLQQPKNPYLGSLIPF